MFLLIGRFFPQTSKHKTFWNLILLKGLPLDTARAATWSQLPSLSRRSPTPTCAAPPGRRPMSPQTINISTTSTLIMTCYTLGFFISMLFGALMPWRVNGTYMTWQRHPKNNLHNNIFFPDSCPGVQLHIPRLPLWPRLHCWITNMAGSFQMWWTHFYLQQHCLHHHHLNQARQGKHDKASEALLFYRGCPEAIQFFCFINEICWNELHHYFFSLTIL